MSEAERRDMLRLIEERKHDLLEKKKLLETLMKGESKKFSATTTTAVPEPTSLLKDVMSAMSEAQSAAAAAVVVPSIETVTTVILAIGINRYNITPILCVATYRMIAMIFIVHGATRYENVCRLNWQ